MIMHRSVSWWTERPHPPWAGHRVRNGYRSFIWVHLAGVGWVYAPLVSLSPGFLPIIEPPPTATPRVTPTINPTYAAAFQIDMTPTRLPTFTPAPPLATLSFPVEAGTGPRIPMGFVVLGLALLGILGAVISFVRGR